MELLVSCGAIIDGPHGGSAVVGCLRNGRGAAAEFFAKHGVRLEVVKHTEVKRGFVLLPRRWVVERSFAWAARFRRLARDYERLAKTLAALHYLAFAILMLANLARQLSQNKGIGMA